MKSFRNIQVPVFLLTMIFFAQEIVAQTPTHYPTGNDPVRWTPVNIIVYIVIPVVLVVLWIVLRRRKTKKTEEKENA